jgi:hypothetical protein
MRHGKGALQPLPRPAEGPSGPGGGRGQGQADLAAPRSRGPNWRCQAAT